MAAVPADGVVVLARRHGEREVTPTHELQGVLMDLFGAERVVVFDGSLRVLEGEAMAACMASIR